jgi:hypothetical protein
MRVEVTLIRRPPTQAPLLAGGLLRRQLDPPVRAKNERLMRRSLTAARNIEGTEFSFGHELKKNSSVPLCLCGS